jgi:hypothetical protein
MCVLSYHVIKEAVLGAHFRPNVDRQLAHTYINNKSRSAIDSTLACAIPLGACVYVYVCPVYVYLFEHGHL